MPSPVLVTPWLSLINHDVCSLCFVFQLFIWLCQVLVETHEIFSCGIQTLSCCMWDLVPWPVIEPSLGVQSFSHWTTREVQCVFLWLERQLVFLRFLAECRGLHPRHWLVSPVMLNPSCWRSTCPSSKQGDFLKTWNKDLSRPDSFQASEYCPARLFQSRIFSEASMYD